MGKNKIIKSIIISAFVLFACTSLSGETAKKNNGPVEIQVWTYSDEVPTMIDQYIAAHPDCGFTVNYTIIGMQEGYTEKLNKALKKGSVDIYLSEISDTWNYTKGNMSKYAAPYEDFGIDINQKIKDAEISQYSIDIGTNTQGKIIGLCYQGVGGVFIYNRSVAKSVFGHDDPALIQKDIGGSSRSWDEFFKAAATCARKKVAIVSSYEDLWYVYENSADTGWLKDGKLYIDPKREAYLDAAKTLVDNKWTNNTSPWLDAWYNDFSESGKKKVLGFFGPEWFLNYTLAPNCGDTYGDWAICNSPFGFYWGGTWVHASTASVKDESKKAAVKELLEWITLDTSTSGLMYKWANGTFENPTDSLSINEAVTSIVVMRNSNAKMKLLGGQNLFEHLVQAEQDVNGNLISQYDERINFLWTYEVRNYVTGEKTKAEAIEDFKKSVKKELGISAAR